MSLKSAGFDIFYAPSKPFTTETVITTLQIGGAYVGNVVSGGLFATYYNGDVGNVPITTAEDQTIDFSGSGFGALMSTSAWPWQGDVYRSLQATGTCLIANDNFAVRWAGMVSRPTENVIYTFMVKLGGASERVKVFALLRTCV
jgi:hypothetical protein